MNPTMTTREIKAWAIVSDEGLQYDANGASMSLAIYSREDQISEERKSVMIEGDKIVPIKITYTT